jgi:hypothetical protein
VADGLALGQTQEDLELTLRKLLMSRLVASASQPVGEQLGDAGGDVLAAAVDGADRLDDLLRVAVLVEVAARALIAASASTPLWSGIDRSMTRTSTWPFLTMSTASRPLAASATTVRSTCSEKN